MTAIRVESDDVLATQCDVLVLKYAQGFYGADRAVANGLDLSVPDDVLLPGKHLQIPTRGKLPSKAVILVGVPQLWEFGYAEIRKFSKDVLSILAEEDCEKKTIAMTMHGVGYGLDEKEAFTAQVAGVMEYLDSPGNTWSPEAITFVEHDTNRAKRMAGFLSAIRPSVGINQESETRPAMASRLPDAGIKSDAKMHIFVAMPFDDEMQDVYEFGICEPVNAAGCLCE